MFNATSKQDNISVLNKLPKEFKDDLKRFIDVNVGKVLSIRCDMRDTGGLHHYVAGTLMFCIDTKSDLVIDLSESDYDVLILDSLGIRDNTSDTDIFGALYTRNITLKMFEKSLMKMNSFTLDELMECLYG